jgi:adenylate cyclase
MPTVKNRVTRKLRAILSADVKGYSLLMVDDEIHTIQTLKAYRQFMSNLIIHHSGRVVDSPGDNLLAEFSSAVDAVECAVEVQKKLKKENTRFVEGKRLEFRIGVNIGDVVQDGDRIYGEGVNIAARIESLADAGGVCISRNTYDHIRNKLQLETEYLGEHEVKNIKDPVRVYKVSIDSESTKPLVEEKFELPDKPSIAVLPFDNMSGDPSQEYFSDGLTEQIINGLSKVYNLFVIARNSSFAYKGKAINIKQIAKELGVRYILEGSVQRAGERVRITAQLIDAATDYHMWSESYDRDLSDIFALQDEITLKLISSMQVNLTDGEQARLYKDEFKDIKTADKWFKGLECFYRLNKQDIAKARILFEQAIKIEETSASLFAVIGWTHLFDFVYGWSESPLDSFGKIEKNTNKAIALNNTLDGPHILLGWIHLFKKDHDKAIKSLKQAIILNPNGADALAHFGFISYLAGNIEAAIRNLKKAFRLNPLPPSFYYHFLGAAYHSDRQNDKALEILNQGISIESETLTPYLSLTSVYIELNKLDQAKISVNKILEIDPNFSVEYHESVIPVKDHTELERYIGNLRKAGLPE